MSNTAKLKEGQIVTILIPFTYTIGDEGYQSGKEKLETIEDCMNEVRAELDNGLITGDEVMLEVGAITE